MTIIHDLRCIQCDIIYEDVHCVSGQPFPRSPCCQAEQRWVPSKLNTDITGGPVYYKSLDREFASKSELKGYLKSKGLSEAGDKVGGARNESHLNLGKGFSYSGQSSRTTASEGK